MKREQPLEFDSSAVELFHKGEHRNILVYKKVDEFRAWIDGSTRPHPAALFAAIEQISDLPFAMLIKHRKLFKHLTGTNPKLWEIRSDQARILCYQSKFGGLVAVHWFHKQSDAIPKRDIKTAENRVKELLKDERQN